MKHKGLFAKLFLIIIPALFLMGGFFISSTNKPVESVHAQGEPFKAIRCWLYENNGSLPYIELTNIKYQSGYGNEDTYCWFQNFKGSLIGGPDINNTSASYTGDNLVIRQRSPINDYHYGKSGSHYVFQFPFFIEQLNIIVHSDKPGYENSSYTISNKFYRDVTANASAYSVEASNYNLYVSDISGGGHSWTYDFNKVQRLVTIHYPDNSLEDSLLEGYEWFRMPLPKAKIGFSCIYYSTDIEGKNRMYEPVSFSDQATYYAQALNDSKNQDTIRFWLYEYGNYNTYVEILNMTFISEEYNEDDVYCWFQNYKGPLNIESYNNNSESGYINGNLMLKQFTEIKGRWHGYWSIDKHYVYQFPIGVQSVTLRVFTTTYAYQKTLISDPITINLDINGTSMAYEAKIGYSLDSISLTALDNPEDCLFDFELNEKTVDIHYPDGSTEEAISYSYEDMSLHFPTAKSGYKCRYFSTDLEGNNMVKTPILSSDTTKYYAQAVKKTYTYYVQYPNGAPNLYLWNASENNTWPGPKMELIDGSNNLYSLESSFSADYFVINDGNGNKSPDINCNTLGSKGMNNVYSINVLDNDTYGRWISMNQLLHPYGPTDKTFRLFVNKQSNYSSGDYTWTFHYWSGNGGIDEEVIRTGYVKAADNGDGVDAVWNDYFDIPKEAIGLRYQFKLYAEGSGNPVTYTYTDIQISTDKLFYNNGDNSYVYYINDGGNNSHFISRGALCDTRTNYYGEYAARVLEAYCTCSDDPNTGYGSFQNLKTQFKLNEFPEAFFYDYLYKDYGNDRGGNLQISTLVKIAMMDMTSDMKYASRLGYNKALPTEESALIVIIVASSGILLMTTAVIFLLHCKKKQNK